MCCSDGDYEPDILMIVLRCKCKKKKNTNFLVRCIIGFVVDSFECYSIGFTKRKENKYILFSMIAWYFLLIGRILFRYCCGKDVYKFNYILFFKCISFAVAIFIFYVASDYDKEIIKKIYDHFTEWEFDEMFLTVVSTASLFDMLLGAISLIFLFLKFRTAKKIGKDTPRKSFYKRFDLLGKSDLEDGSVELPSQQNIFTVDIE